MWLVDNLVGLLGVVVIEELEGVVVEAGVVLDTTATFFLLASASISSLLSALSYFTGLAPEASSPLSDADKSWVSDCTI